MGIISNFHATFAINMGRACMDIHVLDFKCKSVNFDNLFRNKIFGLQLFDLIASFPIHVSGIRPW